MPPSLLSMYNINTITQKFIDRKIITFDPPVRDGLIVIDDQLKGTSLSSLSFNKGVHPYLSNWENIVGFLPFVNDFKFTTWDNSTTYSKKSIVIDGGVFYEAIKGSNTNNATSNTLYWKETNRKPLVPIIDGVNSFSVGEVGYDGQEYYESLTDSNTATSSSTADWRLTSMESLKLRQTIKEAIEIVLSNVINTNPILTYRDLFVVADKEEDVIENENKWVGFRFWNVECSNQLKNQVNSIAAHFTDSQILTLKLYNQTTEIKDISVEYTGDGDLQVVGVEDLEMSNLKGPWELVYDQSTITGNAIGDNLWINPEASRFINIQPVQYNDQSDIGSYNNVEEVYNQNFGLNFNLTIDTDLTTWICDHLVKMAPAIKMQWGFNMLEAMLHNSEASTNRNVRNLDERKLSVDLYDTSANTFARRYTSEIKKLQKSLDNIIPNEIAFQGIQENNYDVF